MKNAIKACSFARKLRNGVTYNAVKSLLQDIGCTIVQYNTDSGDKTLLALSPILPDYAKTTTGFTFEADCPYVCIDAKLSERDKLNVILHEAGHILLGHPVLTEQTLHVPKNPEHEAEANQFARRVMQYRRNIKTGIGSTACVMAIAVCIGIAVSLQPTTTDTLPKVPSTQGTSDSVYVTKDGDRFHRATCPYIDGKDTLELTLIEAQQMYQPCKYCFSDLQ